MGGHERPSNLVPKFRTGWLRFMTSFHTYLDCCGLGFKPEIDISRLGCLFYDIMIVWMCGTKLVQVCEGIVRYLVGWVLDWGHVGCYCRK